MKKIACRAVVDGNRIQLLIRKNETGYAEFAAVTESIEDGCLTWYGDVEDIDDKAQCGLIIACNPNRRLKR